MVQGIRGLAEGPWGSFPSTTRRLTTTCNSVPKDMKPISGLHGHHMYVIQRHTHRKNTHKMKINTFLITDN